MKRYLLLVLAFCSSLAAVFAQTPTLPLLISYHGRIADSTGVLIGSTAPTNREVHFKIYNHKTDSAAANRLYTEKQTVTIANGEFSVLIGSGTVPAVTGQANLLASLEAAFNPTSGSGVIDRYLGISVADANGVMGAEIAPRQQIVTSAFALRAKVAEGLSGAITGSQIAGGSVTNAQIASGTITAANMASSFYSSYPTFTAGLRADAGLNVNHPGAADTAFVLKSAGANTFFTHFVDSAGNSKLSVTTGGALVATSLSATTLSGSLNGSNIVNGTISAAKLDFTPGVTDSSVTNAKIADGAVTATKLSSNFGYAQFPQGARADIGLNLNHPGIGGNTSTMKANGTDNTILQLQSSSGSAVWDVKTNGDMGVAGLATLYNGLNIIGGGATIAGGLTVSSGGAAITGAATLSGGATVSSGLRVNGALNVNHAGVTNIASVIQLRSADTGGITVKNSSGNDLFVLSSAGNLAVAGAYTAGSDRRLKHNINSLTNSLDKLLQLRPVTFEYNDTKRFKPGVHAGFIAQEMEPIFPEWVFTEDDGMKSIGFRGFESYTVQALRELRAEKDAQLQQRDATIAALEKNVAAMKAESADTKAQLAALQQAVAALSARTSN